MTSATDFRGSAAALLDELDPADTEELLARRVDRDTLLAALTDLAGRARADLARRGVPVPSERQRILLLACLSLRPGSYGVKARPDRAAETYLRFLPLSYADPRDLVPVIADHPDHVEALVPLLALARGIRDGLAAARVADPPFFVEPVALAVAAGALATADATGTAPYGFPPDVVAAHVMTAQLVLDRGAALARDHAEAGRATPALDTALPVIGNADFLLRLAGYQLAVATPEQPGTLDELELLAGRIGTEIATAMKRPTGFLSGFRGAEPDVLAGADRYVAGLGHAVAGNTAGRLVRLAYAVRTRHARPSRVERSDAGRAAPDRLAVPDQTAGHAELHALTEQLVAGLFERAEPRLRRPLLDWLCGRRPPDQQDGLADLLRMLRVGVHRVSEPATGDGAPSVAVPPAEHTEMLERLRAAVHPADLTGTRNIDAHRIVHLGLPPLWTRRLAAIRLLTAKRRVLGLRGDTDDRRAAFFRAGTRAPFQFFRGVNEQAAGGCCAPGAGVDPGRSPVDDMVACPHRPWGEIGVVDTYRTISDATKLSPEAVRKYYRRYTGPDRELLLGLQPGLKPEDC